MLFPGAKYEVVNHASLSATKYEQCFVRQMLRSVEIISTLTEFGEPSAQGNVILFQALMAEHEEEILNHIEKPDWNNPDAAQAHNWFVEPFHSLNKQGQGIF